MAEDDARGHDTAEQDALRVRMFERAQEIARQGEHRGDQAWPALGRMLEAFPVDPVAHTVRHLTHHAHIVYVTDRGVIELGQGLGLAQEPGACGVVGIDVDPDAHATVQDAVDPDEEHPLRIGGHHALKAIARAQCHLSRREVFRYVRHGCSTLAATAALHPHAAAAVIQAAPAAVLRRRSIQQEE